MRRRQNREPEPQAIDPRSGFKVPLSNLVREYTGELIDKRFVDRRNAQDFVRGRADKVALPHARPEPPDVFMALNIIWEDGLTPIISEVGAAVMEEGMLSGEGL